MAPHELHSAIAELAPHLTSLATDSFGNYLVSSIASFPAAHLAVFGALRGNVPRLMAHPQGSRVVQAALQQLPAAQVGVLVAELEGRTADVACSTHGSWSVVEAFKKTKALFVARELARETGRLATQQNGSRVVQRVLDDAAESGLDVSEFVDALLRLGAHRLAEVADDRFGNYVVQRALRHARTERQTRLVSALLPALVTLATSKCGSNVAEVLVSVASPAQLSASLGKITQERADELRAHTYGAYVMRTIDSRA